MKRMRLKGSQRTNGQPRARAAQQRLSRLKTLKIKRDKPH